MSEEWKKYPMKLPEENGKKLEYITNKQRTALEKEAFRRRYAHGLILYSEYYYIVTMRDYVTRLINYFKRRVNDE